MVAKFSQSNHAGHEFKIGTIGSNDRGRIRNKVITWGRFLTMITEVRVDQSYTVAEYEKLSPDAKNRAKDVGSYVTGYFKDGKRKRENIEFRSTLSLDLDTLTPEQFEAVLDGVSAITQYEFIAHTTRSHKPEAPKWRIIIPTTREIKPDEYAAVSRLVASKALPTVEASMDAVDDVSHRVAQIMYWPSRSRDGEFRTHHNAGKLLDPDEVLNSFPGDWTDYTQLPYSEKRGLKRPSTVKKAEDPTTKRGLVGAFCRAYSVEEAIAAFIPDIYVPSKDKGSKPRYTYTLGSGTNGAVIEDDGLFLYSHHSSDPCGERLVNAFDMVRLHLFGSQDTETTDLTGPTKLPSFKAMGEMCHRDRTVTRELQADRYDVEAMFEDSAEDEGQMPASVAAKLARDASRPATQGGQGHGLSAEDWELLGGEPIRLPAVIPGLTAADLDLFGDLEPAAPSTEDEFWGDDAADKPTALGSDWMGELDINDEGVIKSTSHNVAIILQNDPRIKGRIELDRFTGDKVKRKPLKPVVSTMAMVPVLDPERGDLWSDTDENALRLLLESPAGRGKPGYGMRVTDRDLLTAIDHTAKQNAFHPIIDKWESVQWDGVPRIDTVFVDFLGAADTPYHRAISRMTFLAAVTRVFEPGHKYDHMVILEGKQGIGKSTFLSILALENFFAEMNANFEDEKANVEKMLGAFICEFPELQQFGKAEVEIVKAFVAKQQDKVRMSYERNAKLFPRKCIFIGTTNSKSYLRDTTGNRRFWPVKCEAEAIDLNLLREVVMQLWAEAVAAYRSMRKAQPAGPLPLYLADRAIRGEAELLQESRRVETEEDSMLGMVEGYLSEAVDPAFLGEGMVSRRDDAFTSLDKPDLVLRNVVCLAEIAQDCFGYSKTEFARSTQLKLARVMERLEGWERDPKPAWHGKWGRQRVFRRIVEPEDFAAGLLLPSSAYDAVLGDLL